jgi:syntaxin 16
MGTGGGAEFFTTQQLAVVDDTVKRSRNCATEELGSIFKELAVLLIDQSNIFDRIDYNNHPGNRGD